jgi:hypothetical protein
MADFFRLSPGFYRRLDKMLGDQAMWAEAVKLAQGDDADTWRLRQIEKKLVRPLGFAEVFTKSGKTAKVPIDVCYALVPTQMGAFQSGSKRIVLSLADYYRHNPRLRGVADGAQQFLQRLNSTLTHELSHARDCLFDPACAERGVFMKVEYPREGGLFDEEALQEGDEAERKKAVVYYNHPTELRSFSKQIAQEVMSRLGRRTPRLVTKATFALGRCSGETIKRAIHVSPIFLRISPYLSEGSLASLYRHVGKEVYAYLASKKLCD